VVVVHVVPQVPHVAVSPWLGVCGVRGAPFVKCLAW
jgi:hypothetical protein